MDSFEVTIVRDQKVQRLSVSGPWPTDKLAYGYRVDLSQRWTNNDSRVQVALSTDAAMMVPRTELVQQSTSMASRLKPLIVPSLVALAALDALPAKTAPMVTTDTLGGLVERLLGGPQDVVGVAGQLGRLLLQVRDVDETITLLGAALSLGVTLHSVRMAGRALYRDGFLQSNAALYKDDKLEHCDPMAQFELDATKLPGLWDWLGKRAEIARLPTRFDFTHLHPAVAAACRPDFDAGNIAQAQLSAFHAVTLAARKRAGIADSKDEGYRGMENLFSPDRKSGMGPHLKVNLGADPKGAQSTAFRLFAAIQQLSNPPRHHGTMLGSDLDSAFEYLVLASLAMRLLDRCEVVNE